MMQNKGTYTQGSRGGEKEPSGTKIHRYPGVNAQYIHDMIASQKGNKPSRPWAPGEIEEILKKDNSW